MSKPIVVLFDQTNPADPQIVIIEIEEPYLRILNAYVEDKASLPQEGPLVEITSQIEVIVQEQGKLTLTPDARREIVAQWALRFGRRRLEIPVWKVQRHFSL